MNAIIAAKLLDALITVVAASPAAMAVYEKQRAQMQFFVDEGRDPTQAEMDAIFSEAQAIHDDIQGA